MLLPVRVTPGTRDALDTLLHPAGSRGERRWGRRVNEDVAPRRLARRGLALVAAAAVVLTGAWLAQSGSAPTMPGTVAWITVCLAGLAALVGVLYLGSAAVKARAPLARTALAAAAGGPVAIALAVGFGSHRGAVLTGIVLSAAGFLAAFAVVAGPDPFALEPRAASRSQRLPIVLAGVVVVAAVLTVGAVDLAVWNPQAKVPSLDTREIYARMIAADQFAPWTAVVQVGLWATFWGGLTIALLRHAARPGQTWMTPRRAAILLLVVVAGAIFFRFLAGGGLSMSIADTFMTSGVNASTASAVLPYVGQLALATAAVLLGWAPTVHRGEAAREPRGVTHNA